MPLEVGQIVDAVVSDWYTDETGSVAQGVRVEEIVDFGNEVVRVSMPGDPNPTESRVHGKVVREWPTAAWGRISDIAAKLETKEREALFQAVIVYTDIEVRNVLREAGRKA